MASELYGDDVTTGIVDVFGGSIVVSSLGELVVLVGDVVLKEVVVEWFDDPVLAGGVERRGEAEGDNVSDLISGRSEQRKR